MVLHGFQKMTLLDYPGKVACTLFTAGCNFRCPFCHNALLVTDIRPEDQVKTEDVLDVLRKRAGILEGVCITGGEPLLHPDIGELLREIKALGFAVKLDTNGTFPDRLAELAEAGLVDYVAMDIKNQKDRYAETAGVSGLDLSLIEQSVEWLKTGRVDYEFRTTVVQEFHRTEDIKKAAEWIRGAKRYYLQNFVDSGNLIGGDLHPVSRETLREMAAAAAPFVGSAATRGI